MTAEVIVDIAHSEVDKIFEYRAVEGVEEGSRVRVPFGRQTVDGYVMRLKEGSEYGDDRLKSISSVIDRALTRETLALARRISERYRCPMALTLRLFLPSEMRRGEVREAFVNIAVIADPAFVPSARAKAQAAALEFLKEKKRAPYTALCKKFGASAVKTLADKGALRVEREKINRSPLAGAPASGQARVLTSAQSAAVERASKTRTGPSSSCTG